MGGQLKPPLVRLCVRHIMKRNSIVLVLGLTLTLFAGHAEAKCFPWQVAQIAYSTATHQAEVISVTTGSRARCLMTFKIDGIEIGGRTDSARFCTSKPHTILSLNTDPYCCDEPPCPKGRVNEIVFIDPQLKALQTKPKCIGKTRLVAYMLGVPTPGMVEAEKRGEGVIVGSCVGNAKQKVVICLSDHSYRFEESKEWAPLPEHWGEKL